MLADQTARPLRILVADDATDCRLSLALLLRLWGHEVCEAANGCEAVERAREFLPDVLLLDIAMPTMDGHAAARILRRTPGLEGALLVAVSGFGADRDVRAALEAGFDCHLLKPYEPDGLERLLAAAAQRAGVHLAEEFRRPARDLTARGKPQPILPAGCPTGPPHLNLAPASNGGPMLEPARPFGVLVLDDESHLRNLLAVALSRPGLRVWTAGGAGRAAALLRGNLPNVELALVDLVMPGADGVRAAGMLRQIKPTLRCWLMTGGLNDEVPPDLFEAVIPKPFDLGELSDRIGTRATPPCAPAEA